MTEPKRLGEDIPGRPLMCQGEGTATWHEATDMDIPFSFTYKCEWCGREQNSASLPTLTLPSEKSYADRLSDYFGKAIST